MEVGNAARGVRAELLVAGVPVGPVRRVAIDERLSGPAVAWVEVDDDDAGSPLDAGPLLGRSAELALGRGDDPQADEPSRRFCGIVREIERRSGSRGFRARLEPGFACLDEERLTRPFVRLSALEILRRLLADGLAALDGREVSFRLPPGARPPDGADRCPDGFLRRPLCVQYDETTYDFCRRLLAEEGLAFLYDHAGPREELTIVEIGPGRPAGEAGTDDRVALAPRAGRDADAESVFGLTRALTRTPGQPVRRWLDLRDPTVRDEGAGPAHAPAEARGVTGTGDVMAFAPGRTVTFSDETDGQVLLTHVRHVAELPPLEAGHEGVRRHGRYENTFACVPARQGYRPPPMPKPRALEDWALVVSGSDDDPIDADPSGCVRVCFLYDRRQGAPAEQRSSWVPVSQAWAGPGHGVQILPRAGMLARIEYMFGDPDRPVVADCFPTGRNTVPAPLPDRKPRLTIRTRSLHEQASDERAWNEIALDDATEAEEVWIRAGRDLRRRVLHDEHATVAHDESRRVGGRQSLRVARQRTKIVSGAEREHVGGARRARLDDDDQRTVGAADAADGRDTLKVDGRAAEQIDGARRIEINGKERGELRQGRARQVTGDAVLGVTKALTVTAGQVLRARQAGSAVALKDGDATVAPQRLLRLSNEGGRLTLAPAGGAALELVRLELRCGAAQVTIGDGEITIKAPTVVARGQMGKLQLDAQGATTAGQDVSSSAVMLNEVKGVPVIFSDSPGNLEPLTTEKEDDP